MKLNNIQKEFISYIKGDNLSADLSLILKENDIPIDKKLSIYRDHYYNSLTKILMDTYPAVTNIVGQKFMKSMCRVYLKTNPPKEACLNLYGDNFSDFIRDFEYTQSLIYLEDVAKLENFINQSYYSIDDNALLISELDNDNFKLKLRSSVKLLKSDFPIDDIRVFSNKKERGNKNSISIDGNKVSLLICRNNNIVKTYRLEDSEFKLLNYIDNTDDLENSIISIMNEYPSFDLSHFLQKFISIEIFVTNRF